MLPQSDLQRIGEVLPQSDLQVIACATQASKNSKNGTIFGVGRCLVRPSLRYGCRRC
jgi:hypothetical protein